MLKRLKDKLWLYLSVFFAASSVFMMIYGYCFNSLSQVDIDFLYLTEQKVFDNYELEILVSPNIDIPMSVQNENIIDAAEMQIAESISNLKIIEFEEEYYSGNRLGARSALMYEGLDGYIWPVPGHTKISSPYGWRNCTYHGREFHKGIDIPAPSGTPIVSCKDGKVVTSTYQKGGYGYYVIVLHTDNTKSLYAHLREKGLPVNTIVSQGDIIGYVGSTGSSTGNHLHYEIWNGLSSNDRINPMSVYE